jgi:hypothetical protein
MSISPEIFERDHLSGGSHMSTNRPITPRRRGYKSGLAMRTLVWNAWFRRSMEQASDADLQPISDEKLRNERLKGDTPDRRPKKSRPGKRLPKRLIIAGMRWRLPLTATPGTLGGSLRQFKLGYADRLPVNAQNLPPKGWFAWLFRS